MPKGKKYFTTALAAVKVKNVAKKAVSKRQGDKGTEKQSPSSESEHSSSEYTNDDGNSSESSYSSDDDEKIIQPSQTNNKQHPASISKPSSAVLDDDSTDSSESEFGCGVYRRREDLTPDSSVASSSGEESSYESESESESGSSQYSTSQHSESQAAASSSSEEESEHHSSVDDDDELQSSESLSNKGTSKSSNTTSEQQVEDTTNSKKKSFFTKRPSFSGAAKNAVAPSKLRRPSTDSHGSQSSKASEPSKSSKGSKVSESSKKKNRRLSFGAAARTAVATAKMKKIKGKSSNKGTTSESDEESVSSSSSEESKSSVESYPSSKISERSKGSKYADEESLASSKVSRKSRSSEASRSSKASKSNSSKPPLNQVKSKPQISTEDSDEDESDDVFVSLLQKARNMKSSKMSNDTNETNYGPDAMDKYKDSADLSHSFKTKSLQNANANLCNSFSEEKTNNTSHAKGGGASRFASMMKDLKSSSDAKPNSSPSNASQGNENTSDDDDGHMFEAPTIIPEDDVPVEEDNDTEHDDKKRQEEQKSRFRTRSESMKKLLHSKSDNIADEDEESSETEGSDGESEEGSDVEVDDGESDEDSTEENPEESMRTASSGEELNTGSGTFDDGSSEEYSTEDEDEDEDGYYEDEQAMTILTPITEVDNETFASTINPRARRKTTDGMTDDDSLEEFNAAISPNPSDVLTEQKSDDREESDQSSEGTSHSSDSQASINSGGKNETTKGSLPNGQHATSGTNGVNKNIQANGVSNERICEYSSMPNVERLSMTEVIARIKSNDPNFKAINLDDADLNDFNATRLIVSLNDNKHITHLSLAQNRLGDGSAASLARVLRDNKNIMYLCLRDNQIGNRGAKAMGDVLEENRTLSYLDLQGNDISPALLETVERRSNPQAPPTTIAPLTLNGEENKFPPSANDNCKDGDSSNNAVEKGRNSSANGPVESHHSCETSQSAQSSFDSNVLETTAKAEKVPPTPLNGKDLLDINESGSASTREIFEAAITSSIESNNRSVEEDALLQALSLALSNLDSEWALNTTDTKTLGDRRRIAPWKLECSHTITGPVDTGEAGEEQQP